MSKALRNATNTTTATELACEVDASLPVAAAGVDGETEAVGEDEAAAVPVPVAAAVDDEPLDSLDSVVRVPPLTPAMGPLSAPFDPALDL